MGTVATKKFNSTKRVFHTRNGNEIVWNDPDIILTTGLNIVNTVGATITYDFGKQMDYIVVRWNIGDNSMLVSKYNSVSSVTKSLEKNIDNNGNWGGQSIQWANNYIYLSDINSIEQINFTSSLSNVFSVASVITFNKPFLNLKKLDFGTGNTNIFDSFLPFKNNLPTLFYLRLRLNNGNNPTTYAYLSYLSTLKYLHITSSPVITGGYNMVPHLPINLYYLRFYMLGNYTFNLAEFFNGNRIGLYLDPQNNLGGHTVIYSGTAIFPSVISEDTRYPIDYIVYQHTSITNKLNGDDLSRFIVDFANQVSGCAINTTGRKIRFAGSTPNTSYTDNSQPLFKTYASALNHITSTLGITVTFT